MVDTIVIVTGFVVGIGVLVGAVSWWLSRSYTQTLYQSSTTKGMNGFSGDVIQLSCPLGQVISFPDANPTTSRGALYCPGVSTCDAFFNPTVGQESSFFSSNIIDVLGNLGIFPDLDKCEGQSQCSFKIPTMKELPPNAPGPICVRTCAASGGLAFVGTYNCIPV